MCFYFYFNFFCIFTVFIIFLKFPINIYKFSYTFLDFLKIFLKKICTTLSLLNIVKKCFRNSVYRCCKHKVRVERKKWIKLEEKESLKKKISENTGAVTSFTNQNSSAMAQLACQHWLKLWIFYPHKFCCFRCTSCINQCNTAASESSSTEPSSKYAWCPQ